jgi:hypothetical protein
MSMACVKWGSLAVLVLATKVHQVSYDWGATSFRHKVKITMREINGGQVKMDFEAEKDSPDLSGQNMGKT